MLSKKLSSRLRYIKGTPLQDRAQIKIFSRRDENYVVMNEEEGESEKYDTFFDYEEELAGLKPSGEQYVDMINSDPFIVMEEEGDSILNDKHSHVVMEPEELSPKIAITNDSGISNEKSTSSTYTDVVGFKFIQCDYVKKDGMRCKRQAPKNKTTCSTHRKYIEKHCRE